MQVGVIRRQAVGLRVVEVLDAVFETAQKAVARRQSLRGLDLQQAVADQQLQRGQGRAFADLGHAPAANHLQQLHDEFDFADTAAPQLDVVGLVGSRGGALGRLGTNLAMQRAQRFEHAEIEVAAPDERLDHGAQRLRSACCKRRVERRDHPRLEPGEALPLAALHQKIFFEHG
ncbi:hypothetical protein GALL_524920 [mine drainage metagenome]|uniref:Uncharacterized protein n=1 Tax=mine drainage metagenome TaxID=410659 RepID=A0A1J5P4A4_9ZZZZ